jgi:hypothetical protein
LKALIDGAANDDAGRSTRDNVCRTLTSAFRSVGKTLWVGGYIIGPDRVGGQSPFKFGSDATVGLATVAQVAGELCGGAVTLLDQDNTYGALALIRQLVEVEYLAWALAEDEVEAAKWLRSTQDDRRRMWQPRHLLKRSGERFRGKDYGLHCDMGGHPSPSAMYLLPEHSVRAPSWLWWLDLATHAASTWDYLAAGAARVGYAEVVGSVAADEHVAESLGRWREGDRLRTVLKEARLHLGLPR